MREEDLNPSDYTIAKHNQLFNQVKLLNVKMWKNVPLPVSETLELLAKVQGIVLDKMGNQGNGIGDVVDMMLFNSEFIQSKLNGVSKEICENIQAVMQCYIDDK